MGWVTGCPTRRLFANCLEVRRRTFYIEIWLNLTFYLIAAPTVESVIVEGFGATGAGTGFAATRPLACVDTPS